MAKDQTDQVYVFHKGDKSKNIEGTGKRRMMGNIQFDSWGKNNGWAKVPATAKENTVNKPNKEELTKEANSETATDSEQTKEETTTENKTMVILSLDDTAVDAIVKIKKLGGAKKLDEIKTYVEGDKRSTVVSAAKKFLNA